MIQVKFLIQAPPFGIGGGQTAPLTDAQAN